MKKCGIRLRLLWLLVPLGGALIWFAVRQNNRHKQRSYIVLSRPS